MEYVYDVFMHTLGMWLENMRHGRGLLRFVTRGEKEKEKEKGKVTEKERGAQAGKEEYYEGAFFRDYIHGRGLYCHADGRIEEGEFVYGAVTVARGIVYDAMILAHGSLYSAVTVLCMVRLQ